MRRIDILQNLLKDFYINQGLTTFEIADKLGTCQATIWKRLHEYKISSRLPGIQVNLPKEKLEEWYISQKLSTDRFLKGNLRNLTE